MTQHSSFERCWTLLAPCSTGHGSLVGVSQCTLTSYLIRDTWPGPRPRTTRSLAGCVSIWCHTHRIPYSTQTAPAHQVTRTHARQPPSHTDVLLGRTAHSNHKWAHATMQWIWQHGPVASTERSHRLQAHRSIRRCRCQPCCTRTIHPSL